MQTYIKNIPSQHLLVQSYFLVDQNCSIWTIKIPERCQGPPFGDFIVSFEWILHTVSVFPLLTFSKYIPASCQPDKTPYLIFAHNICFHSNYEKAVTFSLSLSLSLSLSPYLNTFHAVSVKPILRNSLNVH